MNNELLPSGSWQVCEPLLQKVMERDKVKISENLGFLKSSGFIDVKGEDLSLTLLGSKYYDARFIANDKAKAIEFLREGLILNPAVQAILQLLQGVKNANRGNALSVLKSRGLWQGPDSPALTNLLLVMNTVGLVTYSKKFATLRILYNPVTEKEDVPHNIFIDPSHSYTNKLMLKKVLGSCEGHIHWFDKHFTPKGLEYISEIADANKIKEITILSLHLPDVLGKKGVKEYKDLQSELQTKGISLKWFTIDSKLVRDTHDRWILSKNESWNLPDLNTIISGNRSEITRSTSGHAMEQAFSTYMKSAQELK